MSAELTSTRTYVAVLSALVVLTVITVGVSFLHLEMRWHVTAGLTIAAIKASLVVLFFMHATSSPRKTWCVIVIAVTWLAILFALTFVDFVTRSSVPYVPGH
jgi:cytochrome c oxidase subunit 4